MKTPYTYIPLLSDAYRGVRRQLRLWRHKGNAVQCDSCKHSFGSWMSSQGSCPNCGAGTRHKFMAHHLDTHFAHQSEPQRVLLFAPDPPSLAALDRLALAKVTTTDLTAPDVDHHWDITALECPDAAFDVVICSHVLEHVPDDSQAMRELHRILSADGLAFIQVPYARDVALTDEDPTLTDREERIRRFGQFDHVRLYGRDFLDRLSDAGFDVEEIAVADVFDADTIAQKAMWNDILFRCTPRPTSTAGQS